MGKDTVNIEYRFVRVQNGWVASVTSTEGVSEYVYEGEHDAALSRILKTLIGIPSFDVNSSVPVEQKTEKYSKKQMAEEVDL